MHTSVYAPCTHIWRTAKLSDKAHKHSPTPQDHFVPQLFHKTVWGMSSLKTSSLFVSLLILVLSLLFSLPLPLHPILYSLSPPSPSLSPSYFLPPFTPPFTPRYLLPSLSTLPPSLSRPSLSPSPSTRLKTLVTLLTTSLPTLTMRVRSVVPMALSLTQITVAAVSSVSQPQMLKVCVVIGAVELTFPLVKP